MLADYKENFMMSELRVDDFYALQSITLKNTFTLTYLKIEFDGGNHSAAGGVFEFTAAFVHLHTGYPYGPKHADVYTR